MSGQNLVLLIAGLINLIMSILVISRGWRNKVNLYFSLLTFFNFLWALGLFFSRYLFDISTLWLFWAQSTYFSALGIIISLFNFSIYFPLKIKNINKYFIYIISIILFVLWLVVFKWDLFIVEYSYDYINDVYVLFYNKTMYLSYSVFFLFLGVFALYNLIYKYVIFEKIFKKQILFLLITVIFGLIFGAYFDLVLCYFNIFKFNWLGPLFTLPMNFAAFYLVYISKK